MLVFNKNNKYNTVRKMYCDFDIMSIVKASKQN